MMQTVDEPKAPRKTGPSKAVVRSLRTLEIGDVEDVHEDGRIELVRKRIDAQDVIGAIGPVRVSLQDCVVSGVDLSLVQFETVASTSFAHSKFDGTDFEESVRTSSFDQCVMRRVNFRMTQVQDVEATNSTLQHCDFYEGALRRVTFHGSTFEGVGFDRTELIDVDLRELREIDISDPSTLRGCMLTTAQVARLAPHMAASLGIGIEA